MWKGLVSHTQKAQKCTHTEVSDEETHWNRNLYLTTHTVTLLKLCSFTPPAPPPVPSWFDFQTVESVQVQ